MTGSSATFFVRCRPHAASAGLCQASWGGGQKQRGGPGGCSRGCGRKWESLARSSRSRRPVPREPTLGLNAGPKRCSRWCGDAQERNPAFVPQPPVGGSESVATTGDPEQGSGRRVGAGASHQQGATTRGSEEPRSGPRSRRRWLRARRACRPGLTWRVCLNGEAEGCLRLELTDR